MCIKSQVINGVFITYLFFFTFNKIIHLNFIIFTHGSLNKYLDLLMRILIFFPEKCESGIAHFNRSDSKIPEHPRVPNCNNFFLGPFPPD